LADPWIAEDCRAPLLVRVNLTYCRLAIKLPEMHPYWHGIQSWHYE